MFYQIRLSQLVCSLYPVYSHTHQFLLNNNHHIDQRNILSYPCILLLSVAATNSLNDHIYQNDFPKTVEIVSCVCAHILRFIC